MAQANHRLPMSLRERAALRTKEQGSLSRVTRPFIYPLVIILAALTLLAAGASTFEYWYRGRIYPSIQVLEPSTIIDVGGLTQSGAAAKLEPFSRRQRFRTVSLHAFGETRNVLAVSLGYGVDGTKTARQCYLVGRTGSFVERAAAQMNALASGVEVPVAQYVDSRVLHAYLLQLAHRMDQQPRPGVVGYTLNIVKTQRLIRALLLSKTSGFIFSLPIIISQALPAHHAPGGWRSSPGGRR